MRIALAPLNPTVGDIAGNESLIEHAVREASGADLVVLPELSICGYPPRDLLREPGFVDACERAGRGLARLSLGGPMVVVGCPVREGGAVRNALLVLRDGVVERVYRKRLLPTYDVFDEERYFVPGDEPCVVDIAGVRVGLAICEDLWTGHDAGQHGRYEGRPDPLAALVDAGAGVVVAPSASPFVVGKHRRHVELLQGHARRHGVWVLSVNQAGANDDLIFDGHALAYDPAGTLRAAGPRFGYATTVVDLDHAPAHADEPSEVVDDDVVLGGALALGVREYVRKTGFRRVLIGLSGGIDSAVTAALAVMALGAPSVTGVAMPGPYSSDHALADAKALADNLGVRLLTLPIIEPMEGFCGVLDAALSEMGQGPLGHAMPDIAQENLQSRLRGTAIMALSNRMGALVLTTGNKTELAVGYSTLYGDMNGALAPIADLSKGRVYSLARAMNGRPGAFGFDGPPIPPGSIEKPPSAELAPGQRDDDTLPPYDVLDEIVRLRVERGLGVPEIARQTGHEASLVARMCRLIAVNEYKRSQYGVVLKVSPVAFGPGRRMPLAQGWWGVGPTISP